MWQDISTAPKDGTEFLAFDAVARKMDVCVWHDYGKIGWFNAVQQDGEWGPSEGDIRLQARTYNPLATIA